MSRLKSSRFDLNKRLLALGLSPLVGEAVQRDVWQLPSMDAATKYLDKRARYWPSEDTASHEIVRREAVDGDAARLAHATEYSESLIADAILADPRLGRRSRWTRGEEGEIACPALLSEGDDAPCFYRKRAIVGQPNGSEPVHIVISTDSTHVPARTAAAFIATVRLVQQWRPVYVVWQGAWLAEDMYRGWVFHVPLIQGDMDFARLEFCIASRHRDYLSWCVMMARACETTHRTWKGCQAPASWSYLPDTPDAIFVSHSGITPDGRSVAYQASRWLGWESHYEVGWEEEQRQSSALQRIPDPQQRAIEKPQSPAEKKRQEEYRRKYEAESEARRKAEARARAEAVGDHVYT